jgi:Pyruvate/2-oxoacid:ferredoxin oxidoreductase delta subunit
MPKKSDWTREELERDYVGTMTALTIPVNLRLEGKTRILDLSEVEAILRDAKTIAIADCGCRRRVHKCNAPLDVCIGLDKEAETMIAKEHARKASLAQARGALRRSHQAGLVHVTYTNKGEDRPFVICSCCSCCCHSLSALIRFGMPGAVTFSSYITAHDPSTCTACGACAKRCQFQARRLLEGRLIYDARKCAGCGLCVTTCPTHSTKLVPRALSAP